MYVDTERSRARVCVPVKAERFDFFFQSHRAYDILSSSLLLLLFLLQRRFISYDALVHAILIRLRS